MRSEAPERRRMGLTPRDVLTAVGSRFGLTVDNLRGPLQTKRVSEARRYAYWAMRDATDYSFPEIGDVLGSRDHSTAIAGVKAVQALLDSGDLMARGHVEAIRSALVAGLYSGGEEPLPEVPERKARRASSEAAPDELATWLKAEIGSVEKRLSMLKSMLRRL